MSEEQSLSEYKKLVQRVIHSETNDFFSLAKISGQDPKNDFAGANLSGVRLSGGDLRGANLRNTNLSGADFTKADLSGADLTKADLSCANLAETNLSGTNLTDSKLEYARFRNNQGLSEAMKLDLSKRGGIFEDPHPEIEYDVNFEAYKKERVKWLQIHKGKYVALVDGKLVDSDKNRESLINRLNLKYPDQPKFIKKIDDKEEKITDVSINWN